MSPVFAEVYGRPKVPALVSNESLSPRQTQSNVKHCWSDQESSLAQPQADISDIPYRESNDDNTEITALISRLQSTPTQGDTDKAADLISRAAAQGREAELEKELRKLLQQPATKTLALNSLSRFAVLEFDADLASLLPVITTTDFGANLDLVLAAAATSGGGTTVEFLKNVSSAPFTSAPTQQQLAFRIKLWRALFSLDPIASASTALIFYGLNPAGRWELENSPEAVDMLTGFIDKINRNPNSAIQLLNEYEFFIGKVERVFGPSGMSLPPLDTGPPTSGHYKILMAIQKALLSFNNPSPAVLSALLRFTQAEDSVLGDPARAADYSAIERSPWLLPGGSFVLSISGDSKSRAWKTISNKKIGLPRDIIFLEEPKYAGLRSYELLARQQNLPVPEGSFKHTMPEVLSQYNAFVDSIFQYLGSVYNLDVSGIKVAIDAQSVGNPPDSELPYRYVSMFAAHGTLIGALSTALQRKGQSPQDSASLASVLVTKEFERRSVVLYSLLAARRRTNVGSKPFDISRMDDELDELSAATGNTILRSTITSDILPGLKPGGLATQLPSNCGAASMEVIGRRYSFDQGLFEEKIKVTCATGEQKEVAWVGAIPLPLVAALRRHPRLLDFPGTCLTSRELTAEAIHASPVMEDIDYVRNNTLAAIPYLAAAIVSPDIPWRHVRDNLMLESLFGRPLSFLQATSQPFNTSSPLPAPPPGPPKPYALPPEAKALLDLGVPGGIGGFRGAYIASSNDAYAKDRADMERPFLYLISYRTQRLTAERLKPHVESIKTEKPCGFGDLLCYAGCCGYPHHHEDLLNEKNAFLTKIYQAIADGNATEDYLQAWDVAAIRNAAIRRVELRQMILKPDLKEFFGTYEVTSNTGIVRYVNIDGKLDPLPDWVLKAMAKDPNFLFRFNIDLAGVSEGAGARLAMAALRLFNSNSGPLPALELLDRTGFYPLSSPQFGLRPSLALFDTVEGRIRATEMNTLAEIYDYATGGSLPEPGAPKPAFVDAVRSQWDRVSKVINDRVASESNPIIEKINQRNNAWSIFFSVTLGGPFPVFTGSYTSGSIGINLSTSFTNSVAVSGSVNGINTPQLNIPLPSFDSTQPEINSSQTRNATDAALASMPTRMAVTGTSYRAVRDLASVETTTMTPGPLPPAPAPTPLPTGTLVLRTEVPTTWMILPPLPTNWKEALLDDGQRQWLGGLVARAAPKLSQQEKDAVVQAVKAGVISDQLLDMLVERGNAAIEEENIAARRWVRTKVVSELVPTRGADGTNLTQAQKVEYMRANNAKSQAEFDAALKKVRDQLKAEKVFVDGMPAVSLTYGNDFTVMLWRYDFQLVTGAQITLTHMYETPFWLIDHVRKDPNGHVLEKLSTAATESMLNWAGVPRSLLGKGEQAKFKDSELLKEQLKEVVDSTGQTLLDKLKPVIEDYFKQLSNWLNSQAGSPTVAKPFVPPPAGAPLLNFFPPPYEWALRRDEPVPQILMSQRESDLARKIRTGEIVIVGPTPFP
jgi:hypothetical protein